MVDDLASYVTSGLGKGGGSSHMVDFSGYRLSIAKVIIWGGGGEGRETNERWLYLIWLIGSATSIVL